MVIKEDCVKKQVFLATKEIMWLESYAIPNKDFISSLDLSMNIF